MTRGDRRIRTQLATIAFFAFVRLRMNLVTVAVRELLIASLTLDVDLACVKLLYMNSQISLATASGRAELALENWFFAY